MKKHTKQTAFDVMWNGLKAQGWQKSMTNNVCTYRGDNGRKCAVGHLIPDEIYHERMERIPIQVVYFELGKYILPTKEDVQFFGFLEEARWAHDYAIETNKKHNMESCMRRLAKRHNLTIPEEGDA